MQPTIRSFARIALAVITAMTLFSVGASNAQQPAATPLQSYDVELVIFRILGTNLTQEDWAREAGDAGQRLSIPDEDASATAEPSEAPPPPTAPAVEFPPLPQSRVKLQGIEDALKRSRNYQPLAHLGWTQPGFPRDAARYMSINSLVPANSGLHGQIALSRGRFLHLTLDLVYDAAVVGDTPQRYVIRQTRRMRSNEKHYIDHPKFGVIAIVTPAEAG